MLLLNACSLNACTKIVLWAICCCRYSWRHQMAEVHATGQWDVVAVDMRGYNTSDKPKVCSVSCGCACHDALCTSALLPMLACTCPLLINVTAAEGHNHAARPGVCYTCSA
jgi:pimeloyl-ACP methyl ester carboxylesterase